jgi:hypothetical protein
MFHLIDARPRFSTASRVPENSDHFFNFTHGHRKWMLHCSIRSECSDNASNAGAKQIGSGTMLPELNSTTIHFNAGVIFTSRSAAARDIDSIFTDLRCFKENGEVICPVLNAQDVTLASGIEQCLKGTREAEINK